MRARSCLTLRLYGVLSTRPLCPWDSPGKDSGVGCHAFLLRLFPTRDWTRVSCGSCVGKRMLYHRATWEAPGEGSRRQNKPEPPVVINVMDWNVTGWGAWKDELLWGRVIVSLCKSGQDRLCEKVIFEWTPGNSKRESCVSVLEEFIQRVNKPRKSWRGNTPHMEPEEASEHRWDGWRNSDWVGPCRPLKNTTFYLGWIRKPLKVTMLNLTWALCSWKPEIVQETLLLLYPGEWLTAKNYSSTHDWAKIQRECPCLLRERPHTDPSHSHPLSH